MSLTSVRYLIHIEPVQPFLKDLKSQRFFIRLHFKSPFLEPFFAATVCNYKTAKFIHNDLLPPYQRYSTVTASWCRIECLKRTNLCKCLHTVREMGTRPPSYPAKI